MALKYASIKDVYTANSGSATNKANYYKNKNGVLEVPISARESGYDVMIDG